MDDPLTKNEPEPMGHLEHELRFEKELRDLLRQTGAVYVSDIMFRVLKDRIIEERKIQRYVDYYYWELELRKQEGQDRDQELPLGRTQIDPETAETLDCNRLLTDTGCTARPNRRRTPG